MIEDEVLCQLLILEPLARAGVALDQQAAPRAVRLGVEETPLSLSPTMARTVMSILLVTAHCHWRYPEILLSPRFEKKKYAEFPLRPSSVPAVHMRTLA